MADLMQGYNAVMQGGMQGYNIAKLIGKEFDDYYDRKAFEEADKERDTAIEEANAKSALARAAAMTKPSTDPASSLGKTADVPSPNAIEAFGGYKPAGTETSPTPAPQPTSSVIGGSNALGSAADVDGSRTVSPTYKPGLVDNPEGYTTGEQKQEAPEQSSVVKDNATSGMVTDRKAFDAAESERTYAVGKARMEADIKKMGIAYNRMMQNGEYGKAMEMKDKIDNKRASMIAQEVSYKLDSGDPDTMEKALKMVNSHLEGVGSYAVKDGVVTFTDKDGKVHENYEPPAAVMQAAKALVISDAVLKHFSDNQTQAANKKDATNALQQFSKDERQKKLDKLTADKTEAEINNLNAKTEGQKAKDAANNALAEKYRAESKKIQAEAEAKAKELGLKAKIKLGKITDLGGRETQLIMDEHTGHVIGFARYVDVFDAKGKPIGEELQFEWYTPDGKQPEAYGAYVGGGNAPVQTPTSVANKTTQPASPTKPNAMRDVTQNATKPATRAAQGSPDDAASIRKVAASIRKSGGNNIREYRGYVFFDDKNGNKRVVDPKTGTEMSLQEARTNLGME